MASKHAEPGQATTDAKANPALLVGARRRRHHVRFVVKRADILNERGCQLERPYFSSACVAIARSTSAAALPNDPLIY